MQITLWKIKDVPQAKTFVIRPKILQKSKNMANKKIPAASVGRYRIKLRNSNPGRSISENPP